MIKALFVSAKLALLSLILAGCATTSRTETPLPPQLGNLHLLYLQEKPCRSLYVEIDAVEGTEPSARELIRLKEFLREWCEKPGVITFATTNVIPRAAARGYTAISLARKYMDGPCAEANASSAAFLYVLFYDNRVNRNPLHSPLGVSQGLVRHPLPRTLARPENPHVFLAPYPGMIYVDRSWMRGLIPRKYRDDFPVHEAAHVLGLVRRESRVNGLHCATKWCCMSSVSRNISSDLIDRLKGRRPRPDFCQECESELRQYKTAAAFHSVRFAGPVMVRDMGLYHVLTLPQSIGLYIVDSLEPELPGFISGYRAWGVNDPDRNATWLTGKLNTNPDRALQAINAAKSDADPAVRSVASRLETLLRTEHPISG